MTKLLFSIILISLLSSCAKNWNYSGKAGAKNWGNLKEEFKFCKIGYNQSPIDVTSEFREEDLQFFYADSEVTKKRKDHVLQIEFLSREFLLRGKKKYFIRHLEFHHPSEHLIKGEAHSLELQIYHKSDDEQWLVLTKFLEIGKKNSEFEQFSQLLLSKKKEGRINLSKIIKKNEELFFYDGSFTTPPCKEGVKWYISKVPLEVSKEQMNQIIRSAIFVKSNARPVQEFHPDRF